MSYLDQSVMVRCLDIIFPPFYYSIHVLSRPNSHMKDFTKGVFRDYWSDQHLEDNYTNDHRTLNNSYNLQE